MQVLRAGIGSQQDMSHERSKPWLDARNSPACAHEETPEEARSKPISHPIQPGIHIASQESMPDNARAGQRLQTETETDAEARSPQGRGMSACETDGLLEVKIDLEGAMEEVVEQRPDCSYVPLEGTKSGQSRAVLQEVKQQGVHWSKHSLQHSPRTDARSPEKQSTDRIRAGGENMAIDVDLFDTGLWSP